MRLYYCLGILLATILACKSRTIEQLHTKKQQVQQIKDCPPGEDTLNIVTTFCGDTAKTPTGRFYSIVSLITSRGLFKPDLYKTGKLKFERETSKRFPVAY